MITHQQMFILTCLAVIFSIAPGRLNAASELFLDQLVQDAMRDNADLRAARAKWEAMQERPRQQRALPNPMLTYGSMDRTDGGQFPNSNEKRFGVEQQFPWFGKRPLRGKIAEKEAEVMGAEYDAIVREVIMMMKESYFDLYAAQRSLAITRSEEDVLRRIEKIAITQYSTGKVTQQDVLKAQAEISMLKKRLYELEQQEITLKAKLNQLLNRRADSPLGLAVTAPQQKFEVLARDLFELAEKMRPEIKQARAQIERNRVERDLMKKEFWPDYKLGLEYRQFARAEDAVMFAIGVDLPLWLPKYRAGLREAEKMIESSRAALETAERRTSFDVQDAYFKLTTARRIVDLYKTALIPQAEARLSASEAGYRTGKVDFLDLLESERFLLNIRVMSAFAEGNLGMELARLERAVGTDLPPAPK